MELTRKEIRKLFKAHRGSQAEVARLLGVSQVTVGLWLRRRCTSARLQREIPAFAQRLIAREAGNAAV